MRKPVMAEAFEFYHLSHYDTWLSIKEKSKDAIELLDKWGVQPNTRFATFSFNKSYALYQSKEFARDFLKSPAVNKVLSSLSESWNPLSLDSLEGLSVETVLCSVLSMGFFDRLISAGVVRASGHIVKCFDECVGDYLVSDELRKMLVWDESDHYELFSETEKKEFLFRMFKHLVLGGTINQYEDELQPYLDVTKLLYKELISVAKDLNTQQVSVVSQVLKLEAKVKETMVFPSSRGHEQTFFYLIVDAVKRQVKVWHHVWT